jgi:hypothetical protein
MTSINFKILLKFYIWTRLQILKTQINNIMLIRIAYLLTLL